MVICIEVRIERNLRTSNNNAIFVHIRKKGRLRPTFLTICYEDLYKELNITLEQVQEYERGATQRNWLVSI